MNIFINILVGILCLLIGYIFGSMNFAIIIGKLKFHQDPRDYGSGNAGATNAGRLWGKKIGILIIVLDVAKTILPLVGAWLILTFVPFDRGHGLIPTATNYFMGASDEFNYIVNWPAYYLCGVGAVSGHCWPLFEKFKGGKGAAAFLGLVSITTWMFGLIFLPMYKILKAKTRIVSKSVLITCGTAVLCGWIFSILYYLGIIPKDLYWLPTYGPMFIYPIWGPAMSTICYAIVVFRHRGNIQRLIAGTERKIDDKL